jgi:hypothetical protein
MIVQSRSNNHRCLNCVNVGNHKPHRIRISVSDSIENFFFDKSIENLRDVIYIYIYIYIYIIVISEVYFLTLKKYLYTNIDSIKDKSELQRLE